MRDAVKVPGAWQLQRLQARLDAGVYGSPIPTKCALISDFKIDDIAS